MREIPFFQRLQMRLTLLILVVVAVLAGATAIMVTRGFNQARLGAIAFLEGERASPQETPGALEENPEEIADVSSIVRATLINLVAIFLFTLVGATVFSRTLLTEPIAELVRATRELTAGNLGVTLPVKSRSELGLLAEHFNQMSLALAEARDHLEQRVDERTSDLQALLELSNSTALTLELHPLLAQILERLGNAVRYRRAAIFELSGEDTLTRLLERGDGGPETGRATEALAREAALARGLQRNGGQLALPLVVRDAALGALVLEHPDEGYFDEDRVRLAAAFANQVGVALENARLYLQAQEKAAFEERQHLARELHDSVSQALYAILLGTHAVQRQLERSPGKASEALQYVENLAQAGLAEMRALIFELRPESLEKEGLTGALRKQMDAMESRHGLEALVAMGEEPELPFATKQVLFRVAQEALHNVVKHARARQVRLELVRDEGGMRLTIEDDGVGFDTDDSFPGHLGLQSMRERVQALGGRFELASRPGAGTRVGLRLPLARPSRPETAGAEP